MANRPTELAQELTSITGLFCEGWGWVGRVWEEGGVGALCGGTKLEIEEATVAD